MKKLWTPDEIEYAKKAYAEGKREKIIALELGRSEASVSKMLTRNKVRCKRDYKSLNRGSCCSNTKVVRFISVRRAKLDVTFNGTICNWTSADEVLRYLAKNHSNFVICYQNHKPTYKIQNIEVSLTKVLMEANKIRLQKGEPVFHIEDITE